jgi:hypothetical protein
LRGSCTLPFAVSFITEASGEFREDGWKHGRSSWNTDYTAADRDLAVALRRLTRVHVRSFEPPVDLDDGDKVFIYPWLYAVGVGLCATIFTVPKNGPSSSPPCNASFPTGRLSKFPTLILFSMPFTIWTIVIRSQARNI